MEPDGKLWRLDPAVPEAVPDIVKAMARSAPTPPQGPFFLEDEAVVWPAPREPHPSLAPPERQRTQPPRGAVPADVHLVAQVQRVVGRRALLEVADVEGGQGVADEAVHGPVLAVHVQVHQAGDEVGREGDHERLGGDGGGRQ